LLIINKLTVSLIALAMPLSAAAAANRPVSAQCAALIKGAGAKLQIIRSGDLVGDGAHEYLAVERIRPQPKDGIYVSRVVIARSEHGHCSVVLDAGKDGPRNPVGYIGVDHFDDAAPFYGYWFNFAANVGGERYPCELLFTWLNQEHKPRGGGVAIAWNAKLGRFQRINDSWEFFDAELPHLPHR
jgi:hypothetical protein